MVLLEQALQLLCVDANLHQDSAARETADDRDEGGQNAADVVKHEVKRKEHKAGTEAEEDGLAGSEFCFSDFLVRHLEDQLQFWRMKRDVDHEDGNSKERQDVRVSLVGRCLIADLIILEGGDTV